MTGSSHTAPSASSIKDGPQDVLSELSVLVIDDSTDFASLIAISLRRAGCVVHVSPDGASGLVALEELDPRVVLLDMELPDTHGLQLANTARRSGFSGVLIGLSAGCDETLIRRTRNSGLDDFVAKPCDLAELTRLVAALAGAQVRSNDI